jgi:selenocysteine lyase/cysteine desulfurase
MTDPTATTSRSTPADASLPGRWRDEFPIFERAVYLNSCSLGALSRQSRRRVERGLDEWDHRGAANWYDVWWNALDQLRSRYGRLVHAAPGEIALHSSITAVLGAVAGALDTSRRRRIVTTTLDFPTLAYQWLPRDVDVVLLESPDNISTSVDMFADAIDDRTALVATSHVNFTSGAVQDVAAIADVARRHGALTLIDGYQAAGQIPVDVTALGVDFYCAGGLKWLLGGTGITFLYARRETTHHLMPSGPGWFAHHDQFAFDPRRFSPHDDARRFEGGTPALLAVFAQLGGLDVIEAIGVPAIRRATSTLVEDLVAETLRRGLHPKVASDPSQRTAIVMVPRPDPRSDVARLAAADFIVDARPGHVRISPFFYNVADDHRALLEVLCHG